MRNLKALGLALLAALAVSAVSASAASAEKTVGSAFFTANVGAAELATIEGNQVGTNEFHLLGGLGKLACETATFHGRPINSDTTNKLGPSSTTVTIIPTYAKCHAIIFGTTYPATVTMLGCDYEFDAITTETGDGTKHFAALTSIECPEGVTGIQIHIYQTNDPNHVNTQRCTLEVPEQTDLPGIVLTNDKSVTPDDILAHIDVSVAVTRTYGTFAQCGPESGKTNYTGTATLKAKNAAGTQVAATVSD